MSHSDYEWYYRVNLSAHLGRPVVPHRGPRLCLPACLPACLTLLWGFLVSQGKLGPKVAKEPARPPARLAATSRRMVIFTVAIKMGDSAGKVHRSDGRTKMGS